MEEMFLQLGFCQTVAMKLVDDKGIESPLTLSSLSDENFANICNIIRRLGGLVSRKMPDWGNHISILAGKILKLAAFMFKSMQHCFKAYGIRCVNNTSVLHDQHQWELE